MDVVREYAVGQFRGNFPNVDIAPGVDMEALKELGAEPFFATLPIVPEVGAISNNGLLYDDELVSSIERQINEDKPGGIFGHLKDADRESAYPLPSGTWVGAKREGNTLWGKVFLPSGPAREHIRTLRAVGGSIATSIYGKGKFEKVRDGVRRLTNFKLESLDFAPPSRAALGYGATPHVTSEYTWDISEQEQEAEMPVDKAQVIAELTVADIPAAIRETIIAEASKQDETAQTIAELTNTVTAKDALISELNQQIDSFRLERLDAVIDAKVAELIDWQASDENGKAKVKKLRELLRSQIVTRLGDKQTAERVAEMAPLAWEDLKPIAEMMRDALAGPAAVVSGRVREMQSAAPKLEDTPETRAHAMSQMGIQI